MASGVDRAKACAHVHARGSEIADQSDARDRRLSCQSATRTMLLLSSSRRKDVCAGRTSQRHRQSKATQPKGSGTNDSRERPIQPLGAGSLSRPKSASEACGSPLRAPVAVPAAALFRRVEPIAILFEFRHRVAQRRWSCAQFFAQPKESDDRSSPTGGRSEAGSGL